MSFQKLMLFCAAALMTGAALVPGWAAERETALFPQDAAPAKLEQPPLMLMVGVNDIYCKNTSCKCIENVATRQYGDFCRQLKERYNIELKFVYLIEPYELNKAFLDGKFDAVLCKPWLVFQHSKGRSEGMMRVADLQGLDGDTGLWGIVIVPTNSAIKKLSELSGRRLAYGQPDAYEKHQGALELFQREGVKIDQAKLVEKASCLECLDLLMKNDVDAAVISNYALTADCAVDVTTPDAFRVIGRTKEIPLTSFMVDLQRVSQNDALRIQKALIGLSRDELPASMSGGGFVKPVAWKVPRATP
jgi:ABC-type phosphate/phosphonate transport system substrate-binding protein